MNIRCQLSAQRRSHKRFCRGSLCACDEAPQSLGAVIPTVPLVAVSMTSSAGGIIISVWRMYCVDGGIVSNTCFAILTAVYVWCAEVTLDGAGNDEPFLPWSSTGRFGQFSSSYPWHLGMCEGTVCLLYDVSIAPVRVRGGDGEGRGTHGEG